MLTCRTDKDTEILDIRSILSNASDFEDVVLNANEEQLALMGGHPDVNAINVNHPKSVFRNIYDFIHSFHDNYLNIEKDVDRFIIDSGNNKLYVVIEGFTTPFYSVYNEPDSYLCLKVTKKLTSYDRAEAIFDLSAISTITNRSRKEITRKKESPKSTADIMKRRRIFGLF